MKSSLHFPLNSIYEEKIYTKEYRHFFGIKIIIINKNKHQEITNLLNKGKFKVVPFSNNYYKLNIEGFMDYFISYYSENLFVKSKKYFIT